MISDFCNESPEEAREKVNSILSKILIYEEPEDPNDPHYPFYRGIDYSKLESGIDLSTEEAREGIAEGCNTIAKFIYHLEEKDLGGREDLYYLCYMGLVGAVRKRLDQTLRDKYREQHLSPKDWKYEIEALAEAIWEDWGYHKLEDERPELCGNDIKYPDGYR